MSDYKILFDRSGFKDIQAIEAQIPLCVLKLNNEFDLLKERYANWPQPKYVYPYLKLINILKSHFLKLTLYIDPYIDMSDYKILFDRSGFVKNDDNENPFDLRLCNNCKQSLKAGNTSIFSLANM
ncbi:hypothetical protein Glove_64g146 [Diversispora epigaea]|uniref:Uncharacterized protein n=1 Tax=Diversispora epigaea TaxID=1348612 RepID=A0A397JB68_9GLOM|nr:hypothetical protein Glove_64g146 [Diversispora epigaea]